MATLQPVELAALVTRYGFADRVAAVAVILGESGGDTGATNREPGNVDRGLWQISNKHHPNVSDAEAYDVDASTAYALTLSKGGSDYSPWNATRHTNYPTHVQTARAAVAARDAMPDQPTIDEVAIALRTMPKRPQDWGATNPTFTEGVADNVTGGVIGDIKDGVQSTAAAVATVAGYAGKALGLLTSADFWRRAGFVVAGVVLLVLGLVAMFGRGALRATPAGAIADAASDAE